MPAKPTPGSFPTIRCPSCGEPELAVQVAELALVCTSCGEQVTKQQIDAQVSEWARLARWIDAAKDV